MIYLDKKTVQHPHKHFHEWWSRIWSDDLEELHEFVKLLPEKGVWFQDGVRPHYQIARALKPAAEKLGAVKEMWK